MEKPGLHPADALSDFLEKLNEEDDKVNELFRNLNLANMMAKDGIPATEIDAQQFRKAADILISHGLAHEAEGKVFLNYQGLRGFTHVN